MNMVKNNFWNIFVAVLIIVISGVLYFVWPGFNSPEQVFCTQEAKLCSDGSYVGRTGPKCEFTACPKEDLIVVESPFAFEEVSSPLVVKGKARGTWYFEASFPVRLFDDNGKELAVVPAQAKTEWMTTDFVDFEAELNFATPATQKGYLVFEKDNPSGLPEHADQIKVPVSFNLQAPSKQTVKLYYYNPDNDKDSSGNIMCSRQGLVSVERQISYTATPIQDTIRLLLQGNLTTLELASGITTEFPLQGVELVGASLKNSILTLEFKDPQNKTGGGSCRVGILWFQIEAVAKQFPGVESVRFIPEELFQP